MSEFPDWWPENPYPKSLFSMTAEEYAAKVPDNDTRTAISGLVGRVVWNTAARSILNALKCQKELEEKE